MTEERGYSTVELIALCLVVALGFVYIRWSMGLGIYDYGSGTVGIIIPAVKHAVDPTFFSSDWVITKKVAYPSPRYVYIQLLAAVSTVLGMKTAFALCYILASSSILGCLYLLSMRLYDDRLASILVVAFFLFNTPWEIIDIAGNHLFQKGLIPAFVANALILPALVLVYDKRYVVGYVLLGLATIVHPINGFWLTATATVCVFAVTLFANESGQKSTPILERFKGLPWLGFGLFGLVSSVIVAPLAWISLTVDQSSSLTKLRMFLHFEHYLWPYYGRSATLLTVAFCVVSIVLLYLFRRRLFDDDRQLTFTFAYVATMSVALFVFGYVFTDLFFVDLVVSLRPLRADGFLFVPLVGGVAKLGIQATRRILGYSPIDPSPNNVVRLVLALAVCFVLVNPFSIVFGTGQPDLVTTETDNMNSDKRAAYNWIRTNTPKDAVFLASPANIHFRLGTDRATVISIMPFTFNPASIPDYHERIQRVCNTPMSPKDYKHVYNKCRKGYSNLNQTTVRTLSNDYNVDYILTKNQSYDFPVRFQSGPFTVYEVS